MTMHDNEFETKKNKIQTKDKIEPQHIHNTTNSVIFLNTHKRLLAFKGEASQLK